MKNENPIVVKNSFLPRFSKTETADDSENCDQMIAPVNFHDKVSTIYCPQVYK